MPVQLIGKMLLLLLLVLVVLLFSVVVVAVCCCVVNVFGVVVVSVFTFSRSFNPTASVHPVSVPCYFSPERYKLCGHRV